MGDPFQPYAVGLLLGAREVNRPVMLGGGVQMLAILSAALTMIEPLKRKDFISDISVATTAWIVHENIGTIQDVSSFASLIQSLETFFDIKLLCFASSLRFHKSTKKVLRDYEQGYIKEGVGVGAFTLLAQVNGISTETLIQECELAVDQLLSSS